MSELDYLINECNRINLELAAAHVVIDAARQWRSIFPKTNPQFDFDAEEKLADALAAYDSALKDNP